MKMPIDKEWYEKRAAAEGDLEIGAGSHRLTMTLNLTDEEVAKLEELALDGLPGWARDKIKVMRAALLAIRDADDIHPSSSTHDVEQSRHRFRDIARHALAGYAPSSQPNVAADWKGREGCVGAMTPSRAVYFLERFKREEKMLGPHEQWALDFAIAALSTTEGKDNG